MIREHSEMVSLPESSQNKRERFVRQYQIPSDEAKVLTSSKKLADYFKQTATASKKPNQASHWIRRGVLHHLKEARGSDDPQLINKVLKEILDGYKN